MLWGDSLIVEMGQQLLFDYEYNTLKALMYWYKKLGEI